MPTVKRLISKFDKKDREILEHLIDKLVSLNWSELDIKKLQGYQDIFRLRKGKLRIIFTKNKKEIYIINIDRRNDKTYNF